MINSSPQNDRQEDRNGRGHQDRARCTVCSGKKYRMVETRKVSGTPTVYVREACPACAEDHVTSSRQKIDEAPQNERRRMSGTGYLRNKKRRRKDD